MFTNESSPANARLYSANSPVNACIGTAAGPFELLAISDKLGSTTTYFSGPVQFYVEEGHTPAVHILTGLSTNRTQNFAIVGYLIDKTN